MNFSINGLVKSVVAGLTLAVMAAPALGQANCVPTIEATEPPSINFPLDFTADINQDCEADVPDLFAVVGGLNPPNRVTVEGDCINPMMLQFPPPFLIEGILPNTFQGSTPVVLIAIGPDGGGVDCQIGMLTAVEGPWPYTIPEDCAVGEDCCVYGKPRLLTMQYTADACSDGAADNNDQGSKYKCDDPTEAEDPPDMPDQAFIVANDNKNFWSGKQWFPPEDSLTDGLVDIGDVYDIDAAVEGEDKLKKKTYIHVFRDPTDGDGFTEDDIKLLFDLEGDARDEYEVQRVEFKTDCSKPLVTGDQFGAHLLIACEGEDQSMTEVEDLCAAGVKPQALDMVFLGDYGCSLSLLFQGEDGGSGSEVDCEWQEPIGDCDPACVNALGEPGYYVVASRNKDSFKEKYIFNKPDNRCLAPGDVFSIDAGAGEHLPSKIYIRVYCQDPTGARDPEDLLIERVEFKTNCSEPLVLCDIYGSSMLIDFTPED